MTPTLKIYPGREQLGEQLAEDLISWVETLSREKDCVNIALSGGRTPSFLFRALVDRASGVDWQKARFFWVDERCVPAAHPESNFGAAYSSFLEPVSIAEGNYFRIRGEDDPEEEAERYGELIREMVPATGDVPQFDIVLLGMGSDGHTASIFPHEIELWHAESLCAVGTHPETGQKRVTFTGRLINAASKVVFLVAGKDKATIVQEVIRQSGQYRTYPAALVNPVPGSLHWYLDADAGTISSKV